MPRRGPGEWKPADATVRINQCGHRADLTLNMTTHARDQLALRDLIMGDLRHLLKFGFVFDTARPATRAGFFKYVIEGTTPNSEGRTVCAVLIPDGGNELTVVTVMWRDEQ
jgi:hypothetical protein